MGKALIHGLFGFGYIYKKHQENLCLFSSKCMVNAGRFPWPGSRPSDGNPGQSVCRCSPQSTDGTTNVNGKEMAIHIRCKGFIHGSTHSSTEQQCCKWQWQLESQQCGTNKCRFYVILSILSSNHQKVILSICSAILSIFYVINHQYFMRFFQYYVILSITL